MSAPRNLTAEETLDVIRKIADEEDALDRVEAMSDDEVERYLVKKGVDLRALDANAEAFHVAAQASLLEFVERQRPTNSTQRRRRRAKW